MKTRTLILSVLLIFNLGNTYCIAQSKPTRDVNLPTEKNLGVKVTDYTSFDTGFFASGELIGGCSIEPGKKNLGFTELSAIGGYRISEYLRAGLGLGARFYINSFDHDWALPLFINLRGNFITTQYRDVVPFWSFDVGTTFPDGFMFRPTVGIRVGQKRSAFIASLGYLGQNIRTAKRTEFYGAQRSYYSFITLKLGYEF